MTDLVELLEVRLPLARGDSVSFLALSFVVAAARENTLSAFFHVFVKHGVGDARAVKPKRLDHVFVVLLTFLEGSIVVNLELKGVLGCSFLPCSSRSHVGVLVGWGDWV